MKPNIVDVASHAGVSKATVSRVINHNPKVNPEIRERVLAAIQELGYQPSAIAQNLATSTTNTIGLILPDITNPYFPALARGIEDAAHRLGYGLFICNTDNDFATEQEYIQKMVHQRVVGIILISSVLKEKNVKDMQQLNIPFVLCDRLLVDSPFDSVTIDNYKAAYEAVLHFIGQGHKDIVHLAGPPNVHSAIERRQAYIDAMRAHQLPPVVANGSFNYDAGYHAMEELLQHMTPTAVFAANDLVALGAMSAIFKKGLRIPEDISVVGCDDILFAQMSYPKLSTISVPAYQIGEKAVELLIDRCKGVNDGETRNIILSHTFIQRES